MLDRLLLGLAIMCSGGGSAAGQPPNGSSSRIANACVVPAAERARLLTLPYEEFDTDQAVFSWRSLNDRGCTDQALELLERYMAARSVDLTADQRSEASFHAGQALTFANRNAEAAAYFEKALEVATKDEWSTYVAAHLAYARGDLISLRRARDHYAEIAPGSVRLGFLNGLLACPRKRYMEAAYCGH